MTAREALRYVDRGADCYLRAMGTADHMQIIDDGTCEIMRSKGAINDLCSVYNVRIEDLRDDELIKTIDRIRALGIRHIWWPLAASDRVLMAIHGRIPRYSPDDFEIYGCMDAPAMTQLQVPKGLAIKRVSSIDDFITWCRLDNETEHGGNVIFYPPNHMHLIESGKLTAYLGCVDGAPVATSAILNDGDIASLEFVSTLPGYRRRGIARTMCHHALTEGFGGGAKVITTRGIADGRGIVVQVGFRVMDTMDH